MKTKELTGYGVTGIKIELNLMDRYEASHLLERVSHLQEDFQTLEEGEPMMSFLSETMCILDMMGAFLSKIALKSSEKGDMFTPEEDEPVDKETEKC